jgi:hypothetical protein
MRYNREILMGRAVLAFLATVAVTVLGPKALTAPRPGVWFSGDFETGSLQGWDWDLARRESAVVVAQPVRKGRYAVRITLSPGDRAASKERAELKVGNKDLERTRGRQGGEIWYGWSFFLPVDYANPPGDQFQILGQWHHRPVARRPGERPRMIGAPPLMVHLVSIRGRDVLMLIGQASPKAPPRTLGARPIRRGAWTDLVFHIKWSTGKDGFVEAWLNSQPYTQGKQHGPTLYSPLNNYLRLGLYRGKGFRTTNSVYFDEVRLGSSYEAVAP